MPSALRQLLRVFGLLLTAFILIVLCLLVWGDNLLVSVDVMPSHVDVAVALQGSMIAERARLAGAMNLLQRGVAERVLLSIPRESFWGQSLPPIARAYLDRTYGEALAARVDFCDTGPGVDSTRQEAEVLLGCIEKQQWRSIAVVTSEYHTRRAGILWRKTIAQLDPTLSLYVESASDPQFQRPWWRHRQAAKIWLGESLKLVWTWLGGK